MKKALRTRLAPREQASLLDWDLALFDKMVEDEEVIEPEGSIQTP